MKTKKSLLTTILLLLGCFLFSAQAQPFTTIYNFTGIADGAFPAAGLVLSGTTLFGTASANLEAGTNGTVFSLDEDGTGFTNLYSFTNGVDGSVPMAGLILAGSTLYGTTSQGGTPGFGTIFSLNTNGNIFKILYAFTNGTDGSTPLAGLFLSGNTLYGTASSGGSTSNGTVFSLSTNGGSFKVLHGFSGGADGAAPQAGLILSGTFLYGTAASGGVVSNGTVFGLDITDLSRFETIYAFTNGSDGSAPVASLLLSGATLYGTASAGGYLAGNNPAYGTIFSVTTNGGNFKTLHTFTQGTDGAAPLSGLILSGDRLYGTASSGCNANYYLSNYYGTVFSLKTDGTQFAVPYSFTDGQDGFYPVGGLILSGGTLYGTAFYGGLFRYLADVSSGSVFALSTNAHPFTTLHSFRGDDIGEPVCNLVLAGGTLYGTGVSGGGNGSGSVFDLSTNENDGPSGVNTVDFNADSFDGLDSSVSPATNNYGANPQGGLVLSGATLYGTATTAGAAGYGTIFAADTNFGQSGTSFTTLYSFTNGNDGATPKAGLILAGNTLYGTASAGGETGNGTVFSLNISSHPASFKTLYEFTNGSDGGQPVGGLALAGGTLYGTTYYGGPSNVGTVFSVHTDGTGFATLYSFTNGLDGADPQGALTFAGNALYGTAYSGGASNAGTVFSINLSGEPPRFKTVYYFTDGIDGGNPLGSLLLSGATLYGTTVGFGNNSGSIFALNTNGSGFASLYIMAGGTDGGGPSAGLVLSNNTLYGTASSDGWFVYGTVFALNIGSFTSPTVPIELNIQPAGKNVILSWNDPSAAFSLQAAPKVTGLFTNVPGATSPYTNAITGSAQFFRLMAP